MKNRNHLNGIQSLTNEVGTQLMMEEDIEAEILGYYKKLFGSRADSILAINPNTMKQGTTLNRDQQVQLIKPVSKEEVWEAMKGISDLKAPSYDGFNALFSRRLGRL